MPLEHIWTKVEYRRKIRVGSARLNEAEKAAFADAATCAEAERRLRNAVFEYVASAASAYSDPRGAKALTKVLRAARCRANGRRPEWTSKARRWFKGARTVDDTLAVSLCSWS